jgi:hypothetical protein
VPWLPELFTAPALARIWEDERRRELALVPFFPGLLTGETRALVESFAGEPELHHPIRGRVKGTGAFERFVEATRRWLNERAAVAEDVDFVIAGGRGVEELVLHLDGVALPVAVASDHDARGQIVEQRMYFSRRPLTGALAVRPPLLQPDPEVELPDVAGEHQRALAAGDLDGVLATFAPDGELREPAGAVHRGTDALRAFYAGCLAGGGIALEHCAVTDDGRAVALEYNVAARGGTALPPQAGLLVYVRGAGGRLAAARIYDDVDIA